MSGLHMHIPIPNDSGDVITLDVTLTDESAQRMISMSDERTRALGELFAMMRDGVAEQYRYEGKH